jgi:CubicO group peptidase (beta-lactamase class C family)
MLFVAGAAMAAEPPVYPSATWTTATPAEAGLDRAGLDRFRDVVGGRGCIVRGGRMVYAWGDAARAGDVASAAKPVYSFLLFRALEEGLIAGLDEPVLPLEPRLAGLNPQLGHKDRAITWRHLANQTSCYGVAEAPGTAYCYNDWQMALFCDLLFLKVHRSAYDRVDAEVLGPRLTEPLGCEDRPTLTAFGAHDRVGRLAISPRDFCRFGLLFLRGGAWRGRQILSREHTAQLIGSPLPNALPQSQGQPAAMLSGQRTIGSARVPDNQTDHLGSYTWLWWLNGVDRAGRRHWPDAPTGLYGCFGHGGKRVMAVVPEHDLVVCWNDAVVDGREAENEAFRRLVAAVR